MNFFSNRIGKILMFLFFLNKRAVKAASMVEGPSDYWILTTQPNKVRPRPKGIPEGDEGPGRNNSFLKGTKILARF